MAVHECPCFNLGLAHRRVARVFEEALQPIGLTIAQVHFLSCLYERDARLSKDLARELGVDAGTLTPMIDRLERQGLIRRCPHPEDRRAMRICLEPSGRRLKDDIQSICASVNQKLMNKFSDEDYERFMELLKLLSVDDREAEALEAEGAYH